MTALDSWVRWYDSISDEAREVLGEPSANLRASYTSEHNQTWLALESEFTPDKLTSSFIVLKQAGLSPRITKVDSDRWSLEVQEDNWTKAKEIL